MREAKFTHIETQAVIRHHSGDRSKDRKIIRSISYPAGVDKHEYDRADRELVRAFGNDNSRTIGTFVQKDVA